MKFSPCLDIFFPDLTFEKRIEAVSKIGYTHFEFWSWWDKNIDEIQEVSSRFEMKVAGCCTKFVSLVNPDKRSEYLDGLGETLEVSKKLGNKIIISQVGDELKNVHREIQNESLITGLKLAGKLMEGTNIILAIEPLNILYDHKGYFLSRSNDTYKIVRAVNSKNVKILFDIYHQQITEGNVMNNIKQYYDQIAHFHIADVPGRGEIGTGEINYPLLLNFIQNLGYQGNVGIELFPKNTDHHQVLNNSLFLNS